MCVCVCVWVHACVCACVCLRIYSTLTVPQISALHPVRMVVPVEMVHVIVLMVTVEVTANTLILVGVVMETKFKLCVCVCGGGTCVRACVRVSTYIFYPYCSTDICTPSCENGGTCRDGSCDCPVGYHGLYCQNTYTGRCCHGN